MKPGATTRPAASMVRFAAAPLYLPTPTILPWFTATSAWKDGSPEPSTTRAFLISRSYVMARPPWVEFFPNADLRGGPITNEPADPPAPLRTIGVRLGPDGSSGNTPCVELAPHSVGSGRRYHWSHSVLACGAPPWRIYSTDRWLNCSRSRSAAPWRATMLIMAAWKQPIAGMGRRGFYREDAGL